MNDHRPVSLDDDLPPRPPLIDDEEDLDEELTALDDEDILGHAPGKDLDDPKDDDW